MEAYLHSFLISVQVEVFSFTHRTLWLRKRQRATDPVWELQTTVKRLTSAGNRTHFLTCRLALAYLLYRLSYVGSLSV
jgi:hypothetical protein